MLSKDILLQGIKILKHTGVPGYKEFDDEKIEIWTSLLSDISDKDFIKAVRECALTSKFFPTIAEIRENALKQNLQLAETAWMEVLAEMESVCGTQTKPSFSSSIVEKVVASLGGLDTIWQAGIEQESFYRNQFVKTYNAIASREQQNDMLGLPTQEEATKILDDFGLQGLQLRDI